MALQTGMDVRYIGSSNHDKFVPSHTLDPTRQYVLVGIYDELAGIALKGQEDESGLFSHFVNLEDLTPWVDPQ